MQEILENAETISSGTPLGDIETNFRVIAGPGAGKTHWLLRQIKKVVEESDRLGPSQKVACLSFTNVAVEQVRDELFELGVRSDNVEVSTIHSFLYRNVLRPYAHLLENGETSIPINHSELDGHEEHETSVGWLKKWFEVRGDDDDWKIYSNEETWIPYLESCSWVYDDQDGWKLRARGMRPPKYLPLSELSSYKISFWQKGILHHEDVLYLSNKIFANYPKLFEFLSYRFPYFFADEFQDTQPVQAELLSELAERDTTVGVIGDPEQAIYGFRGGDASVIRELRSDEKFGVEELKTFQITGNRRSDETIIDLLSELRADGLDQEPHSDADIGHGVQFYDGQKEDMWRNICAELADTASLAALAYRNDDVSEFRAIAKGAKIPDSDIWQVFREEDSNDERRRLIRQALRSLRLIIGDGNRDPKRVGIAIRELKKAVKVYDGELKAPFNCKLEVFSPLERKALATTIMQLFASKFEELKNKSVKELWNNELRNQVESEFGGDVTVSQYQHGDGHDFAEETDLEELYQALRGRDETRHIRTIHKAKGAEFENVLVWFPDSETMENTLRGADSEDKRLYYVGLSRARKRLFLGCPDLTDCLRQLLEQLDIEVN
jgi:DNA helicase-2/ATP-dependent DNA helicase PcrA